MNHEEKIFERSYGGAYARDPGPGEAAAADQQGATQIGFGRGIEVHQRDWRLPRGTSAGDQEIRRLMIMPLELKSPDDLLADPRLPLTLAACDEHEDACRRCIDDLVTQDREREPDKYLGLPFASHRATFTRGESDIVAAPRLLRQEQRRKEQEQQQ